MTTSAPDMGRDIACSADTEDADGLFSEATGLPLVRQDLRHRLTTDSVLGPNGAGWGFDVRALLGSTASTASVYQARIKKACTKDPRILSAAVVITDTTNAAGLSTLTITVSAKTALGPFSLIFTLDPSLPAGQQLAVYEAQQ